MTMTHSAQHLTPAQAIHMALVAPEPFDRQLCDEILAQAPRPNDQAPKQWVDGYQFAVVDIAYLAARIVAERVAPVPSDEESWDSPYLTTEHVDIAVEAYNAPTPVAMDTQHTRMWAALQSVRAAVQPAPVIPEGWELVHIERDAMFDNYEAYLWHRADRRDIWAHEPTWLASLASAIAKAEAGS
jgi:hypothetical protein